MYKKERCTQRSQCHIYMYLLFGKVDQPLFGSLQEYNELAARDFNCELLFPDSLNLPNRIGFGCKNELVIFIHSF